MPAIRPCRIGLINYMNNIPTAHFHVRIDAAGQYAVNLELFLRGLKLPMTISVGEPKRNKDYQKAHFPKRTTDDTESQAMARFAVVELPDATPAPSAPMILLREVAGRLQSKVKQTTQAINRLHNLLARVFPELATLTEDISAGWVLKLLDKYPTAERIAQAQLASLEKIPYLSVEQAQAVHQAAKQSVASLRGDAGRGTGPRSREPGPALPEGRATPPAVADRPPLLTYPPRRTSRSSPSPASARPPPQSWSPRSWTSIASPRPTTWSAISASFPRKAAPASTSTASPCPQAH